MKLKIMTLLLGCMCLTSHAQAKDSTSFLSKIYFPFDLGYTVSDETTILNDVLIKTGLEYRFKQEKGLYVRFNFNNRNNECRISENPLTSVIEGRIKFDDYVIGLGYRIGKKEIRGFGLCQAGISNYNYPSIIGNFTNFKIIENQATTPVFITTFGIEYYVAKNAALTIETVYLLQTSNAVFWNKSFSTFGISIGLTTALF